MEQRVKSLHDIKHVVSPNNRYELKVCETYMYVQDMLTSTVLVEISLNTEIDIINSLIGVFGFAPIVIVNETMSEQIEKLKAENTAKDAQIERMKDYIQKLESSILVNNYTIKKAIRAYGVIG